MDWDDVRPRYPQAQRVPGATVEMVQVRGFVSPDECASLIALIDAGRRPSTIADDNGDPAFRTSETCDLFPVHPVVVELDRRIAALLGLDAKHGEVLQGQRYAVGQEFKTHTDWFEPDGQDYERYCAGMGQRTWTAMAYLNVPRAGGATRFKAIDKIVQPETGKLLCWNNLSPGGRPNPATAHHGMKVRSGEKYVITKWFRERETGYEIPPPSSPRT